jgi:hypothetical protein
MSDSHHVSADFRELLRIELEMPDLEIVREQELMDAVSKIAGVENVSLAKKKAAICYDPVQVTQDELTAAITSHGFTIAREEAHRASLMAEPASADDPERVHGWGYPQGERDG